MTRVRSAGNEYLIAKSPEIDSILLVLASVIKATSVINWRSPEGSPKIIIRTKRFAICDAYMLVKAHLESRLVP